jgi:hypothetical protein
MLDLTSRLYSFPALPLFNGIGAQKSPPSDLYRLGLLNQVAPQRILTNGVDNVED